MFNPTWNLAFNTQNIEANIILRYHSKVGNRVTYFFYELQAQALINATLYIQSYDGIINAKDLL